MEKPKMPYRYLGNSGLKVSVVGFGNWLTGHNPEEIENQCSIIKRAHELGINFFDTAETYGTGEAEKIMGTAIKRLKADRTTLVITTKLFWCGSDENQRGNSRKKIIESLNNSLKRLDLSYVDVVFSHRPDFQTPLQEICQAFNSVIENNKAFYWGTSEWPAAMIVRAIEICESKGWHKPICEQPQYNLFSRERFESEYRYLYEVYGYGTTIWSPLCSGVLTGKYNDGVPEDSRVGKSEFVRKRIFPRFFEEGKKEKTLAVLKGLKAIADREKCSLAQLALAWTIVNKDVSVCILGASKVCQLEENVKSLELVGNWTGELEKEIRLVMDNEPKVQMDFRAFAPNKQRRDLVIELKKE